jgi:hypothetical protein
MYTRTKETNIVRKKDISEEKRKTYDYHNFGYYPSLSSFFKHDVSETIFCLRFQVKPTQLEQIDTDSLCPRTPATTPLGFIMPIQQESPTRVNVFHKYNLQTRGT